MELWIVLDSLSGEPEVFRNEKEAGDFACDCLCAHGERWRYEKEEIEDALDIIRCGRGKSYLSTSLGECEVSIFKKKI